MDEIDKDEARWTAFREFRDAEAGLSYRLAKLLNLYIGYPPIALVYDGDEEIRLEGMYTVSGHNHYVDGALFFLEHIYSAGYEAETGMLVLRHTYSDIAAAFHAPKKA